MALLEPDRISVSLDPLDGSIVAGQHDKSRVLWQGRRVVTTEAISAVIGHILHGEDLAPDEALQIKFRRGPVWYSLDLSLCENPEGDDLSSRA